MDIQEFKFEYEQNSNMLKNNCPYIGDNRRIGSMACHEYCGYNKGTDYANKIVKCAHPKKVNGLFNCACPYCDSEHFEQIQCELDDTRAYIVAKCLDCDKKFDLTYACIKIDKIKEE